MMCWILSSYHHSFFIPTTSDAPEHDFGEGIPPKIHEIDELFYAHAPKNFPWGRNLKKISWLMAFSLLSHPKIVGKMKLFSKCSPFFGGRGGGNSSLSQIRPFTTLYKSTLYLLHLYFLVEFLKYTYNIIKIDSRETVKMQDYAICAAQSVEEWRTRAGNADVTPYQFSGS